MKFQRFEDIIAWQKGQELTLTGYKNLINNKDFTFKNQFLSACISIPNNIAEGFERRSNKEFKQFLFFSKGSAGEVRSPTRRFNRTEGIKVSAPLEMPALALANLFHQSFIGLRLRRCGIDERG